MNFEIIRQSNHLADGSCFGCTIDMTEIGELSVWKRRSRQEIKRLVTEFETSGLRRSEFCQKHNLAPDGSRETKRR
jgi:hypothetical protein